MTKSALMSAIALTSAFGLASCSSTEDEGNINPTFDGQSVKTQFAINIPRAAGNNGTRATADQTQGDGNTTFLGMNKVWLLAFNGEPTANSAATNITDLGEIEARNINAENSKKIYQNVVVNTGTDHFVFYGFASGKDGDKTIGALKDLTMNSSALLSNINFELMPIHPSAIDYSSGQPAKIIDVLNAVDDIWSNSRDQTIKSMRASFQRLTAGSARSVRAMLQEISTYFMDKYANTHSDLIDGMKKAINDVEGFEIDDKGNVKTTLNFPENLGLPDGSVRLKYEATEGFQYDEANNKGVMSITPTSITYPAPLSYYVSTPIYTNSTRVNDSDWPDGTTNWTSNNFTTDKGWTTKNAKVDATTQAIALANNINYGVASLKLQVQCASATLADADENQTIDPVSVPEEGFKVTGLLIGNQPDEVIYNFSPKDDDPFSKTVWDSNVNLSAKNGTYSAPNYTIVLPNNINATDQKEVRFALELVNNSGRAFKGADGIIETDAKFYLIGTLEPTNGGKVDGVTDPSVFMSDYQTTANVKITSLANAYNCIPDIRTTSMQLGLSVDLEWKTGLQYNVSIGGNN